MGTLFEHTARGRINCLVKRYAGGIVINDNVVSGVVDSVRKLNCNAHLEQKRASVLDREISYVSRSNFTFIT